ncbi:MAG: hypothetical protein Q8K79_05165 [Solirubrobacteraceae bacterium]|nr:hypothetical protein [Solirubrobacteraceae bacterium]
MGVTGLVARAGRNGPTQVTGVVCDGGERLSADVVVDAMGRRSPMPGWIAGVASAAVAEEAEDSGFVYYTRFFRSHGGGLPPFRSGPLTPIGTFTVLVLPSDNDTWSVTLYTSAGDQPLKRLRHREQWEAVLRACPAHVQWLEGGEPLTEVLPMGGIVDRFRRLVVDGRPLVTGVALLGDAWSCTNPSAGRGMTLGLLHARHLRDAREAPARACPPVRLPSRRRCRRRWRTTPMSFARSSRRAPAWRRPARCWRARGWRSGPWRSPPSTSRCARPAPTAPSCWRC